GGGGRFGFGGPPRGPRVLPGTYTARLVAGDATLSTNVEVRYDPRIDVPLAELEARQKSLLDLHRLAKPLYEAGQALRKVDERVAAARKALREAGESDAAKAILAEADSLAAAVREARRTLGSAQRSARVGFALEGVSARPTADQLWQIDEAWRVGREAVAAVNTIVGERLPALEAK